jgi:uncharacterized protein
MSSDIGAPWTLQNDGITLTVRVTPRGGSDALDGIAQLADGKSALKVRVRAAAAEGEANAALLKLLAKTLAVPPRDVSLIGGWSARLKRIRIAGTPSALAGTLQKVCAEPPLSHSGAPRKRRAWNP